MSRTRSVSASRMLASLLTTVMIAAAAVVGVTTPAQAAEAEASDASLSWGLRDTWRNYITGFIANGTITTDGAAKDNSNIITWSGGSGALDDETYEGSVSFTGSVNYRGHSGELDITLSNPTIEIEGDTATLYFDAKSKAYGTAFPEVDETHYPIATFTIGDPTVSGDVVTWTTGQGTFTSEALAMFGGQYNSNPYTDSITFSTTLTAAAVPATDTTTTLGVSPEGSAAEGESVELTAAVSPAADGTVEFFDGSTSLGSADVSSGTASITTSALTAGSHSLTATFAPSDSSAYKGSTSAAVDYTVTTASAEPSGGSLSLSPSTDLDPDGATITVTGSGYPGSTVYLQVGSILTDSWAPSTGGVNNTDRAGVSSLTQVIGSASYATVGFDEDGSFTTTVTVTKEQLDAVALEGGVFAVYTVGAGGAVNAANEAYAEFSFAEEAAAGTTTTLSISPESTAVAGSDVSLTATVSPAAAGTVEFFDGSTSLGTADVSSDTASITTTALAVGDHSLTAVFTPADETAYSSSTSDAVSYTITGDEGTVSGATFEWGFKESFRSYITGSVANGNIATDGVSVKSDGTYVWSNGIGSYDLESGAGTVSYTGSVHFTGHDGQLDITLSNPRIEVTSSTTATLYMDVVSKGYNGGADVDETGVAFATLTLPEGVVSDDEESISWSNAAATLTADGAAAFGGFYSAGTELDPASFTFPLAADAAPTPVVSVSTTSVVQGGTVTISGTGFTEGATVRVDVASDPLTLTTATVDASGTFGYTWTVPSDFEVGAHTLYVYQDGSLVSTSGITVTAADGSGSGGSGSTGTSGGDEDQCVAQSVSGATFSWGVKESFRSYITGSIANGSISPSSGSLELSNGSGAYSTGTNSGSVSWSGSIHYTGHSGVLDMAFSNPRIQVNSATSATLYLDVESAAYGSHDAVNATGVAFATISLPTATTSSTEISWSNASVYLTSAGAEAFMGFYEAGLQLDSISFSFPLGAEVACDSTTDGSLAATGGEGSVDALWLGLGLLTLGTVVYVLHRRRRMVNA